MEYIEKKKEKQKPFFSINNYYKYNINNYNEEKTNFIITSKNNTLYLKKERKKNGLYKNKKKSKNYLIQKTIICMEFYIINYFSF